MFHFVTKGSVNVQFILPLKKIFKIFVFQKLFNVTKALETDVLLLTKENLQQLQIQIHHFP